MKIGNFCHIVKDPIKSDLYYAVIQKKFDSEDEWSIIALGETEQLAMQNLIIEIYQRYRNCIGKICQIGKSISDLGDFTAHEDLIMPSVDILLKEDVIFNDRPLCTFDALSYSKETDEWSRYYR